ncbi:RNA-directed DNA polymerase, eukaryota, reverse transcriptase zinc-binding domain protein [Tanacetum coccineum]
MDVIDLVVLSQSSQVMHVQVRHKAMDKVLYCSFIYASNNPIARRELCGDLAVHKGMSWVLMGDFNVALNLEDSHSGSSQMSSAMIDFKDCVSAIDIMDINCTGLYYTWNQKPKSGSGILKKLDRVMGNLEFVDAFPGAHAIFQPYRISDHSPAVLKIPTLISSKPKPFKFFNFLTFKSKFLEVVADVWNRNVDGHNMFQVVSKMKSLKKPFRKLIYDQGNLHDRVVKLRAELDEVQKALDLDPDNVLLREEEAVYVEAFNVATLDEERFLKQKAKIEWLDVGDSNSAYFHKSVKGRNQRSRIEAILNSNNIEVSGPSVPDVFVAHYEAFLGNNVLCEELNVEGLFQSKVTDKSYGDMVRHVSDDEIKAAMFDIGDDRTPGPNGYTSAFFKKGWDIVGPNVCKAIHDFFTNNKLLKEINHTFIALIPKQDSY